MKTHSTLSLHPEHQPMQRSIWYLNANAARNSKPHLHIVHSQKVVPHRIIPSILMLLLLLLRPMRIILRRRVEDIPLPLTPRADFQYTGQIAASVAVVGCAPDRRQSVVEHDHVPFITQLVRAQDVRHTVDFQELLHHLRSESVSGASRAKAELIPLSIRITPDQIRHRPFVRDFSESVDDLDLVDTVDTRAQAAVHTEDLVVDDAG